MFHSSCLHDCKAFKSPRYLSTNRTWLHGSLLCHHLPYRQKAACRPSRRQYIYIINYIYIYIYYDICIYIYIYIYISYILLKLVIPDDFPKIFLTSSFFRSPWDAPVGFPELRCSHEAKFTGQALGTMPGITGIATVEFSTDFTVMAIYQL